MSSPKLSARKQRNSTASQGNQAELIMDVTKQGQSPINIQPLLSPTLLVPMPTQLSETTPSHDDDAEPGNTAGNGSHETLAWTLVNSFTVKALSDMVVTVDVLVDYFLL